MKIAINRRQLLALAAAGAVAPHLALAQQTPVLTKPIPSTGESIPLVGLGSWITFNVGDDPIARDSCADVMRAFFDDGGLGTPSGCWAASRRRNSS